MRLKYIAPILTAVLLAGAAYFLVFPKSAKNPLVVVILLDTLRADHLSAYGHHHQTSPELDAFGKNHFTFSHAYSAAPWTPPSVASLFTGLYASAHGMTPSKDKILARETGFHLKNENRTMAEFFRDAGYSTTAISANPWISEEFGFAQGFDSFSVIRKGTAEVVTNRAIDAINVLEEKRSPIFLYLQYIDPHHPYRPPEAYKDMFPAKGRDAELEKGMQKKIRLYDGEIRYLDDHLGRFFRFLKEKGVYDDAIIVITADHGEQFMDHGEYGHGLMLHNEEIHVPLFLKPNHNAPGSRIDVPVSVTDILPTILSLSKIELPKNLSGVSLFDTKSLGDRDGVMAEVSRTHFQRAFIGADGKKLVMEAATEEDFLSGRLKVNGLFDSIKEPAELMHLDDALRISELQMVMIETVERSKHAVPKGVAEPQKTVSSEAIEQLKSLGYLQ